MANGAGQRDPSVGMDGRSAAERPERVCEVLATNMEGADVPL